MLWLELALGGLYGAWLALTIAKNFPISILPRWIETHFTSSLISWIYPRWSFFAPTPGMHDYHLLYRDQKADQTFGDWHELKSEPRRVWSSWLWNPGKTHTKAMIDVAAELAMVVRAHGAENELLKLSMPYLIVLAYVSSIPRIEKPIKTQFLLMRRSMASPEEVYYVSPFHRLSDDNPRPRVPSAVLADVPV